MKQLSQNLKYHLEKSLKPFQQQIFLIFQVQNKIFFFNHQKFNYNKKKYEK